MYNMYDFSATSKVRPGPTFKKSQKYYYYYYHYYYCYLYYYYYIIIIVIIKIIIIIIKITIIIIKIIIIIFIINLLLIIGITCFATNTKHRNIVNKGLICRNMYAYVRLHYYLFAYLVTDYAP